MRGAAQRRMRLGLFALPLLALASAGALQGCVGYGGGYAEEGYGLDYYEPYGYDYGWGGGYWVGPRRDHDHERHGDGGGHPGPSGRVPSIPGHPHSGGFGRGGGWGGGHGGGGHR